MRDTKLEQLVAESHPEWTGFTPELLALAARSDECRRAVLVSLADRLEWSLCSRSSTHPLLFSEKSAFISEHAEDKPIDRDVAIRYFQSFSDFCWQPRPSLLSLLAILGGLFYAPQVRVEIRKEPVKLWKQCLGDEGYRVFFNAIETLQLDEFEAARRRHDIPCAEKFLNQSVHTSRSNLSWYGASLLLACLQSPPFLAVDAIAMSGDATVELLKVRLRSLFPPDQDGLLGRLCRDEHMQSCREITMHIIKTWHPQVLTP